ncbi:MAG: glycerol-3-phosphate 1-O-acyltransferase PlsY [Betaproteobacteria bacterium]|nr:glycerol-3-phosphate 1-O-acyltransferase PlsY [Betaproteobacteria bacterium]
MTTVVLAIAAYLVGSVSFAVIVSRVFRLPDPRTYGSGNPGATNVLRSGNKAAALLTLVGDALKGWLAVWLAQRFAPAGDAGTAMAIAGALSVIGHMYPLFHRFQGGKGVATALGVLFGFSVYLGLGAMSTWLIIAVFFRMSSVASMITALFAPFATWLLFGVTHPFFASVVLLAVLLIYRHRRNIKNILAGTENRFGQKARPGV